MSEESMLWAMGQIGDRFAEEDWALTGLNRPDGTWVILVEQWLKEDPDGEPTKVVITNYTDLSIFIKFMSEARV